MGVVAGGLNPEMGTPALVDGVDHVYVPMGAARAAFGVLVDRLKLPVMWPFTSFGDFSSGGVSVGNIKLEMIEANGTAPWCLPQEPPQIQGVAFRPAATVDEDYVAEVDARGIPRTAPARFAQWTNLYFSDLVSDRAGAFVCDYHVPRPKDLDLRRRMLVECGGGRLGVLDSLELVVGICDLEAAAARWQRLLDPLPPVKPGLWRPRIGPALRLVPGDAERVDHLLLAVRSEDAARKAWTEVDGTPASGLPLRFVEP